MTEFVPAYMVREIMIEAVKAELRTMQVLHAMSQPVKSCVIPVIRGR